MYLDIKFLIRLGTLCIVNKLPQILKKENCFNLTQYTVHDKYRKYKFTISYNTHSFKNI